MLQELNNVVNGVAKLRGLAILVGIVLAAACLPLDSPTIKGDIGYIAAAAVAIGLCVGERK